jgi:hypothetical protein
VYSVEDALRFFVANKPDALVLDFFSGSGTTAHAVMRLNRQDGGRAVQRCVVAGVSLWRHRSGENGAGGLMAGFPDRQTSDS